LVKSLHMPRKVTGTRKARLYRRTRTRNTKKALAGGFISKLKGVVTRYLSERSRKQMLAMEAKLEAEADKKAHDGSRC
jgi:hypothetical protein